MVSTILPRLLPGKRGLPPLDSPYLVMAVTNATPDSFYAQSRRDSQGAAAWFRGLRDSGVQVLDIGGESSRPGSDYVDPQEEWRRLEPLLRAAREEFPQAILSLDTRRLSTAQRALDWGLDWVNDISALRDDPELGSFVAEAGLGLVLMHMKGQPGDMQKEPHYDDVYTEVRDFFQERLEFCDRCGILRERILLDPGIGFGKSLEHNLTLLKNLSRLRRELGQEILVGLSRKSFIGALSPSPPEQRLPGSLASLLHCYQQGARVFRVHDAPESLQALRVWDALQDQEVL